MKKLLVVVDYQNDFINGALGFDNAQNLTEKILDKVREYTNSGFDIVFTMDTHFEDYLDTQEGKHLPVVHCVKGTWGWEIEASLKQYATHIFEKPTFGSLTFANWLADTEYDAVELCGLVSNICVISNAVLAKAALPEAEIIVDGRLTDSFDTKRHDDALSIMEGLQMTVIRP